MRPSETISKYSQNICEYHIVPIRSSLSNKSAPMYKQIVPSRSILLNRSAPMNKCQMFFFLYPIKALCESTFSYLPEYFNKSAPFSVSWVSNASNKDDIYILTHWGRDKMAAIFQTRFSNVFSWMKMFKSRLRFHWSLFPRVQLTIFQHWFR